MRTSILPQAPSITAFGLAIFALAGCTESGSSGAATGTVQLAAEAAPPSETASPPILALDTLAHLDLAVKRIDVHVDSTVRDDDEATDDSGANDGDGPDPDGDGWITIATSGDLVLRPGGNRIDLGAGVVPSGELTQIRLVLDGDAVLWTGLGAVEVACPSCQTSGLKLMLDGGVDIPPGGTVPLTLMFDLDQTALRVRAGTKIGPAIHVETSIVSE